MISGESVDKNDGGATTTHEARSVGDGGRGRPALLHARQAYRLQRCLQWPQQKQQQQQQQCGCVRSSQGTSKTSNLPSYIHLFHYHMPSTR